VAGETEYNLKNLGGMTLAYDREIMLLDVIPKKCFLFKSAVMPLKLTFECIKKTVKIEHSLVFKNGDDLRSD
jgi:hypothetical protein